ncbi:MAG: hypothetical protein ABL982_23800, partial [Vicinamibacterales bacterium]
SAGVVAMVMHGDQFERMDGWSWLALVALAAAPLVGLPNWPGLRWILASIPAWLYGNGNEWVLRAAPTMTFVGMLIGGVGPALAGRRARQAGGVSLPHLASGPLVTIEPRAFAGGQKSRVLHYLTVGMLLIALVLFVLIGAGQAPDELAALVLGALIISATFAFSNWFADRVRLRVDNVGIHGRTLFREHTARWNEVTGLRLRYMFMLGFSVRIVYYVVVSTSEEVAFPSSMRGASELQAIVEAATGLTWPEPEITANL